MSEAAAFAPSAAFSASAIGAGLGLVARALWPYQLNPFDLNPLRDALAAEVDFAALRARSPIRLLIGATRKLRRLRIGRISAQDEFAGLADESAENLGWAFLQRLRAGSRAAVEAFRRRTRARAQRRR
jgi:hypothetical protein